MPNLHANCESIKQSMKRHKMYLLKFSENTEICNSQHSLLRIKIQRNIQQMHKNKCVKNMYKMSQIDKLVEVVNKSSIYSIHAIENYNIFAKILYFLI